MKQLFFAAITLLACVPIMAAPKLEQRNIGKPSFSFSSDRTNRDVIVHVVPWFPPNTGNRVADSTDPSKNHWTLAADETDETRRIERHLLRMQQAGIDVVALDVMVRNGWKKGHAPELAIWHGGQTKKWLDAMKRVAPEMRFCLQIDRAGGLPPSVEVWAPAIKALEETYAKHPNYYRINGKPVLLSFFLNERTPDQVLESIRKESNSDFFFVGNIVENPEKELGPFTRSVINLPRMQQAVRIFDAIDLCPLGAHKSWLENSCEKLIPLLRKENKPLFLGVGTGYYRRGTAFIEPAWNYMHTLWMIAMQEQADHVIIWTWNDVDEDHDIFPSTLKQDAVLDLMSLYIQWYKTGTYPELTSDRIFLSWPVCDGGRRTVGGGEHPTWPNMNYFAWMTEPAELEIPGIGKVSLQEGLNVGQIGKCSPGLPKEFLLRHGNRIVAQGSVGPAMVHSTEEQPENMKYYWRELVLDEKTASKQK